MNDTELDDMWSRPADIVTDGRDDAQPTPTPRRTGGRLAMAGLVVAGAAVGAVVVSQMNHHSTTTSSGVPTAVQGQLPGTAPGGTTQGGTTGQPPGGLGPGGGLDGEQRLSGTVTGVGSSSVTVKTSSGTATYVVTSSTEIVRNGSSVSLSAIKVGDPVFVHVYPQNGKTYVERLFAGTSATQNQLGPGGPPPGQQQSGGTTSTT